MRQAVPDGMWWLWMPIHRRAHHAPIIWRVFWVVGAEMCDVVGDCGHRHLTADEARACPWEPDQVPAVGAGLVVWIRDPDYAPPHLSDPAYLARRRERRGVRRAPFQLEFALEAQ
jgi:hypothetical protein